MYLGLDIGTSGVKAVLMDGKQKILATGNASLNVSRPKPGWSEQNPEHWWKAVGQAIAAIRKQKPKQLAAVEGVGLSGQQHGATLLDSAGKVLRPAILWNDARSGAECKEIEAREPRARDITGNIAMAGFTAPKLAWTKTHEPRVFEKVAKVLLPKDYVRYRLTGEFASDMSDSAGTHWMDVANRTWSDAMLAATDMSRDQMPKLFEGTDATGQLTLAVANILGMPKRPVVAGGGGDNAAAACGIGAVTPNEATLSIGTSGVLFVSNPAFMPNAGRAVHAFCHAVPGTWHQMGVILSAAASLEWLAGNLGVAAPKLTAALGSKLTGPSPVLFLPYLSGERTPVNDSRIRGAMLGLGHEADHKVLTHAALDGVAFCFRDSLEALKIAGTTLTRATAVGGGTKSKLWLQIIATALGIELDLPAAGDFGGAFGAARLGLIAATGADFRQVLLKPKMAASIKPVKAAAAAYDHAYHRYTRIYPALQEISRAWPFYSITDPIAYEGPATTKDLAYRWYNPTQKVMGKTMAEHLRFAVCYWHTLCWPGLDPFGGETFLRPWHHDADPMAAARTKADVMFETLRLLGVEHFTFHDLDIAPEGKSLKEFNANVTAIANIFEKKMAATGKKLLWGTANMFSNRRFMAGAATNPDPDVFAYCAAQVKHCLDVTHGLGGENYVMWGGREGYETLINTRIGQELKQAGRFLALVVEYKHKIGFKGPILIEPKPKEPTKHQYDYDVATIYGLLKSYGLENDVKMNIEQNHAILAGHSFEHEIALAAALGIFGSLDLNRGDYLIGWDTDQFAMNVPELTLMMLEVLRAGGFTTGGMNFDAKIRRQSIDPDDLLHAHVGSMDACARGLLNAAKIVEDGKLDAAIGQRYAKWSAPENKAMLEKGASLEAIAARVHAEGIEPKPNSGRQEYLESLINRYT